MILWFLPNPLRAYYFGASHSFWEQGAWVGVFALISLVALIQMRLWLKWLRIAVIVPQGVAAMFFGWAVLWGVTMPSTADLKWPWMAVNSFFLFTAIATITALVQARPFPSPRFWGGGQRRG